METKKERRLKIANSVLIFRKDAIRGSDVEKIKDYENQLKTMEKEFGMIVDLEKNEVKYK